MVNAAPLRDPRPHTDLTFAPMTRGDLASVGDLEKRVFTHPWSAEVFLRELRITHSKIVLARAGEAVVGYVCRWLTSDSVEIQNVAVHPEWRRRSIGRALVERVLDEAHQAGVSRALLEVRRHNAPAVTLYRSLGFRESGVRRRYYGDGEDALLMELDLARG